MNYDKKANEENIKKFKRYGIYQRNDKDIYTCVLCGRKTRIGSSMSNQGHKLICNQCACNRFEFFADVREWQNKDV